MKKIIPLLVVIALLIMVGCGGDDSTDEEVTESPESSPTAEQSPTMEPTPTPEASPTPEIEPTPEVSPEPTPELCVFSKSGTNGPDN